ncbi:uncharacterized protein [Panulirus ornatus]|uniref:uncharacterized protein n=1 Tax=Panulirus ornatus TaxID=150431 RepID=UPI003A83F3F2
MFWAVLSTDVITVVKMRTVVKITWLSTMVIMVMMITVICSDIVLFSKMNVEYPDMTDCYLGKRSVSSEMYCGFHCQRHPNCSLFCYEDTECKLYSARVSWHYMGLGGTPQSAPCHSLWGSVTDAIRNSSVTASASFSKDFQRNFATNGFYCFEDNGYCYISSSTTQPWWVAKLGAPRKITSIRVQTRDHAEYSSKFKDVEVRVGDNTSDFTKNQLMGRYIGMALHREVITFLTSTPITGSIVSLQAMDDPGFLAFCDIQILYTA